jgi:hypothetical protein
MSREQFLPFLHLQARVNEILFTAFHHSLALCPTSFLFRLAMEKVECMKKSHRCVPGDSAQKFEARNTKRGSLNKTSFALTLFNCAQQGSTPPDCWLKNVKQAVQRQGQV